MAQVAVGHGVEHPRHVFQAAAGGGREAIQVFRQLQEKSPVFLLQTNAG